MTRLTSSIKALRAAGHDVLIIAPTSTGDDFHGAEVQTVPIITVKSICGGQPWGSRHQR